MKVNAQGFTLIEFMVSLSIGLCLLTFSIFLYINFYKTLFFTQRFSTIQNNGQLALAYLAREVRMAGFIGCPQLSEVTVKGKKNIITSSNSLLGWHQGYNYTTPIPTSIPSTSQTSDILFIQYIDPNSIPIKKAYKNRIYFVKKPKLHPHEYFIISDCNHAEIAKLNNIDLQYRYEEDAHVGKLHRVLYYIEATQRKTSKNEPIYALYRRDLNASVHIPVELVEGIEKLDIVYGVPNHNHPTSLSYTRADQIMDWQQVRTLIITLHLTNIEPVQSHQIRYPMPRANSQLLKRTWQQTITLRARERLPLQKE